MISSSNSYLSLKERYLLIKVVAVAASISEAAAVAAETAEAAAV